MMNYKYSNFNKKLRLKLKKLKQKENSQKLKQNIIIKTLRGEKLWDAPIDMKLIDILYDKLKISQYPKNGKEYIFNFIDNDKNIYKSYDLYNNKEMFVKYNDFTIIIVKRDIPINVCCECGPRDNGHKYDGSSL